MKKALKYLLLTVCTFTIFTLTVSANTLLSEDIPNKSYVIGKSLYTQNIVLTTRHVMLAAKTIESNNLNDMKIYYKNAKGTWSDPLTKQSVTPPEAFQIDYIDLESAVETYEVTFNSNGGSQVATQNISEYEKITRPEDPEKEGYIFNGWMYDDNLFDFDAYITSDIEIEAAWTPITYTIAFNKNSEDADGTVETITCTYDVECTLTSNEFTRENYTFGGWATDSTGEKAYDDEEAVSNLSSTNNGLVILYAYWIPDEFNITYTGLEGATTSNPSKYTIESDDFTLSQPTKEGYTFTGWTGSNGNSPELEVTIEKGSTGDLEYTANWEAITYTISFDKNNQSATGETADVTCTYDQNCTLTQNGFSSPGYEFDGWATDSDGEKEYSNGQTIENLTTTADDTITLYAVWIPTEYAINYNLNGGTASNYNSYNIESETFILNNPEKEGYTFTGWTGSNGSEPQLEITIAKGSTGILSFVANWTPITYTITFNKNSQSATGETADVTCTYDQTCTLTQNGFSRPGYEFSGWATEATGEKIYDDEETNTRFTSEETYELFAVWTLEEYNITYNLNGGSASNSISYNIETNDFVLNNPTKTNYTFIGWTGTDISTPQLEVIIAKGSTGNKTYTANWAITNYEIIYDKNILPNEEPMTNTICTYNEDCQLAANTYTKEGYIFMGWATTNNGEVVYTDEDTVNTLTTTSPTVTLFAIWEDNTYTISYTLNGGSASNPTSAYYDTEIQIANPTRNGYIFTGWTSQTIGPNAMTGATSGNLTSWGGLITKNTYFKNLRETGTVTLIANWIKQNYLNVNTNTYYSSLDNAFSAVQDDQTIRVVSEVVDESLNDDAILADTKSGVKLDLYGHTINLGRNNIINEGGLEIYSSVNGGVIENSSSSIDTVIINKGILGTNVTDNKTITLRTNSSDEDSEVLSAQNGSSMTLNPGVTITSTVGGEDRALIWTTTNGTVVVSGATITANNQEEDEVGISGEGAVYVYSGTINTYGTCINTKTIYINGGNITSTNSNAIQVGNNNSVTVISGTITAKKNGIIREYDSGSTTITIGNNANSVNGSTPVITSTATTGSYYGVSINNYTTLNFYDGKIVSHAGTNHAINGTVSDTPVGYVVRKTTTNNIETATLSNEYTVTLNPTGGTYNSTTDNSTITMTYGQTTNNDIGIPTQAGYTFNGWFTDSTNGTQVYDSTGKNVNATDYWTAAYSTGTWKYPNNVVLYAQWTAE